MSVGAPIRETGGKLCMRQTQSLQAMV